MQTLRQSIDEAVKNGRALGHFNFSTLEGLWAIIRTAQKMKLPVIVGLSEGERDFVGLRQATGLIKSLRDDFNHPIFLNADHSYSFDRVKEAVDFGFDMVIFDGAKLPFSENLKITKQCVEYARSRNPAVVVEGELGYIGDSSKLLNELPAGVGESTTPEMAARFVRETGVDLLAPAVGNVHGMLRSGPDPNLNLDLIKKISEAAAVPLVLHGASGNSDEDLRAAIQAGVAIIHINTELRVAYRNSLKLSLQENPDEVAPYKILKPVVAAMKKVVEKKLSLFSNLP